MKKLIFILTALLLCNYYLFSQVNEEKMEVEGAIQIGDSEDTTPDPGTIRFKWPDFQGFNGFEWISFTDKIDGDSDPTNELQTWDILPGIPADLIDGDDVNDADADPTNELQNWTNLPGIPANIDIDATDDFDGQYSSLIGPPVNVSSFTNDAGYVTTSDDLDADPTNELQTWDILPGIPADLIDGDDVNDADADPTNELQNWTNLPGIPVNIDIDVTDDFDGQYSSLIGPPVNVSSFTNDAGYVSTSDDLDADPTNELQTWDILPGIPADLIDGDDVNDADADPTNELQTWDILPGIPADLIDGDDVNDADADPTNELQNWTNLPGIPADLIDGDDVNDADADPTNELQNWTNLPGIPADLIDGDDVNDADADPTNELQNWTNLPGIPANIDIDATDDFDGQYSSLIDPPVNVSSFTNDAGYVTTSDDLDADPTNELQTWDILPGIPADLIDGDDVNDADADPTNELQNWTNLPGIPADLIDGDDVNDADADPTNELQNWTNLPGIPANIDIDATDDFDGQYSSLIDPPVNVSSFTNDAGYVTTSDDLDADPTNELQTWDILPGIPADLIDGDDVNDADADPTNELQNWTNLPGIPADLIDGDDVNDADADPTNELQNWTNLPGIPADLIDGDDVNDADADPTNELQNWTNLPGIPANIDIDATDDFDGQYSSLIGPPVNVSSFTNDAGYVTTSDDLDADPTNELQTWDILPGIPADLIDGDDVNDADADPTNELQNWTNLPGIPANIDIDATDDFDGQYSSLIDPPVNVSSFTNDAGYVTTSDDLDADPTNELQTWDILPGIPADLIDGDDVNDADADPTNELQNWTNLPGIPADLIDGDDVNDADADPTNELQNWTNLPGIPADLIDGDDVNDADADPTNELQNWTNLPGIPANIDIDATDDFDGQYSSLSGIPADIADGDDINDADSDPNNELELPPSPSNGAMNYWNGSAWVAVPPGLHGQKLCFCNGVPTWGPCPTIQQRIDEGETPFDIYNSDNTLLDSLYGKTYAGGIIAYLNTLNGTGFVAAPMDQSAGTTYGCWSTNIPGAEGTTIGTGLQNTIDHQNGCTFPGTAPDICANLTLNTYSDWFLPSNDELLELRNNLYLNGLGNINGSYWTSAESGYIFGGNYYCYALTFSTGTIFDIGKNASLRVRAIREF